MTPRAVLSEVDNSIFVVLVFYAPSLSIFKNGMLGLLKELTPGITRSLLFGPRRVWVGGVGPLPESMIIGNSESG